MGRDWIIDVLADLRAFARENELPMLAGQLDEAALIAEVELAQWSGQTMRQSIGDPNDSRFAPANHDPRNRQG